MSNPNLIVIANKNNGITQLPSVANLFKDIDLSGITSTIQSLGGKASTLSDKEKDAALEIVDQWETTVIQRLNNRHDELLAFVDFFELPDTYARKYKADSAYRTKLEMMGAELAVKTNTVNEYEKMRVSIINLNNIEARRPVEPMRNGVDNTEYQNKALEQDYLKEKALYEITIEKWHRELFLAEREWKLLVNQHPDIQSMIKEVTAFTNNQKQIIDGCKEQGQRAKVNVMIASDDVRTALHELLNFSI